MALFYCQTCRKSFEENNPLKKEYSDPVFGNCWQYVANCPQCRIECSEQKEKKPVKKGRNLKLDTGYPNCSRGSCCGCS